MAKNASERTRRAGTTLVETAMVLLLFLSCSYGVFEYGRLLLLEHLMIDSRAEGCRYAVVHSNEATVVADVQSKVQYYMANQVNALSGLTIEVFPSTTPSASNDTTAINNLQPDDDVTVRVTGQCSALFPALLFLPTSFQMRSSAIMTCEGN